MKAQQASLFDEPSQEQPTRTHPVAQDSRDTPPPNPTPPTPTEAQDEAERNRRAHVSLEEYIAGTW